MDRVMGINNAAERITATPSALYSAPIIDPFGDMRAANAPARDVKIETEPNKSGYIMALSMPPKMEDPRIIAATNVTTYVSNKSAAIPASSPTLSPTLSAITAGLRASSSGIPASTFPTRSAPTSAPFVKIPPPSRAKTEISEPPNPSPTSAGILSETFQSPATLNNPSPTTKNPVTAPPLNANRKADRTPARAAEAVRTFARTAVVIPTYPASAEATAPSKKPPATMRPKNMARKPAIIIATTNTTLY